MKVIAIGGNPGSGKTTLMKRIIEHYGMTPKYDEVKLVPYLQNNNLYILGKYEEGETFAGTDRMSMAVQPEAIKFLSCLPVDSIVLYEGDRLFTASFLEDCADKYDLSIIHLETTADVRQERYKERGSNQNATWLAGRESKISNILSNLTLSMHVESYQNNNQEEQQGVFNAIVEKIDADA